LRKLAVELCGSERHGQLALLVGVMIRLGDSDSLGGVAIVFLGLEQIWVWRS
jgi:hypothetical protein